MYFCFWCKSSYKTLAKILMSSFPSRNYFYPLKKNTEMPANKEHKPSVDKKLENTVFVIYRQKAGNTGCRTDCTAQTMCDHEQT